MSGKWPALTSHLVAEALRLGAIQMTTDNNETSGYDTKVTREVNGYTVEMSFVATPEATMQFLRQLDGVYGPVVQPQQQYASTPAQQRPAQQTQAGAPPCPKHGTTMATSKFGGFYCKEKDPSTAKGYCIEKVQ